MGEEIIVAVVAGLIVVGVTAVVKKHHEDILEILSEAIKESFIIITGIVFYFSVLLFANELYSYSKVLWFIGFAVCIFLAIYWITIIIDEIWIIEKIVEKYRYMELDYYLFLTLLIMYVASVLGMTFYKD